MVGPTAQIASLTCYLNAVRRGLRTTRFFPTNSTCQFCEFVHFIRQKRTWFSAALRNTAATPDEWFNEMVSSNCIRACLVHDSIDAPQISDRMSAGLVGGGGRWLLCVERQRFWECWEATWELGNRNATDRRIWRVYYKMVAQPATINLVATTVDELTKQLMNTLSEIGAFARKHALKGFADCFDKALQCLITEDPSAFGYHQDLAPPQLLPLPAARLLASCQVAWVFGGMGSWNDLGFGGDDQNLYDELSGSLYDLLNQSICASVNETAVLAR